MQERGVGADLSPEPESLYSQANQKRAREGKAQIRGIVWLGACAMLPGLFLPEQLWPNQAWGSLLGMCWCFGCGLEVAWRSYRRLIPNQTPSRASLWSGGLLLLSCVLMVGCFPQLLTWWAPARLQVVLVVTFIPLMFSTYAGLWMLQFFPVVASVEGRGWRQDVSRAIQLLSGQQLQVLGALLAASLPVSFLSIPFCLLGGLVPGIVIAMLANAAHVTALPPTLVVPLCFGLSMMLIVLEFAVTILSCWANLYQQLKAKTISPA